MTTIKQPLSKLRASIGTGPEILVVVASVTTIFISLIEMFRGALTVGIGWDEPIHRGAFEEFVAGKWTPDSYWGLEAGGQGFIYGNSYQWLGHLVNVARGNETFGQVMLTAESYAVRHMVLLVLFMITLLAVGLIAYSISNSMPISVLSAAVLAAVPVFVGHSIHNPKDVPVACGYTLVTMGCIGAVANACASKSSKPWRSWVIIAAIFAGVWLAVGTRFALWLPLTLTIALAAIVAGFLQSKVKSLGSSNSRIPGWLAPLLGAFAGLVLVVATHPHYARYPGTWITKSIRESGNFAWFDGSTLTGGAVLAGQDLPWSYLPTWVIASLPLGVLALMIVGIVIAVTRVFSQNVAVEQKAMLFLVLLQAFALPLAAIALGSIMYNAQRQHLYIYPALAVLGSLSVWWLSKAAGASQKKLWRVGGTWALAGFTTAALIYPTVERLQLFPYQYVYVNEIATLNGINGQWETDYWATSFREAFTRVPTDVALEAIGPQEFLLVYPHLRGTDADPAITTNSGEYWRIQITNGGMQLPANCRDVDSVMRNFRGEDVVMSWVGICER